MINLGTKVKDKISGFEGVATSKVEYINGCVQFGIQPKVDKDGKLPDVIYLDHQRLETVEENEPLPMKETGGVMRDAPKY